jgi:beta-lactamase superfamily II metal-dependent hydrolase
MTCQFTFLPVGNADSILIQTDNSTIIVDLGGLEVLEDWLQEHNVSRVDRIYITHAHADHFPSLIKLVDFLNTWHKKLPIEKIYLPRGIITVAQEKILSDEHNPKYQRLRSAIKRIREWSTNRTIKLSEIVRDSEPFVSGCLEIQALHPSFDYLEVHNAQSKKLNDISLVLQVVYCEFSALLLADIEGVGLTEFLNFLKINSENGDFTANVVKIPHHGAYPANGDDLKELLALINAEIAILSVGSKNNYGHVKPQLFKALIELRDVQRLKQFICTEVTRTCKLSSSARSTMGKLSVAENCAGEVTIIADTSGSWELKVETPDHPSKVSSFAHAACIGRAELD